ncbi:hypothetical protein GGR57DRAFT_100658 [Xylariaceae sp. FL1272]|nr:hypothetical protein GGR57DRAFT_100658 [Xylariaceae sp. FL1272]
MRAWVPYGLMASSTNNTAGATARTSTGTIKKAGKQLKSLLVSAKSVTSVPRRSSRNGFASGGNGSSSVSSQATSQSTDPLALQSRRIIPSSPATSIQPTESPSTQGSQAIPNVLAKIKTNGVEKFHQRPSLMVFKELPIPDDTRGRFEELQNLFRSGLAEHIKLESFQYAVMWDLYMVGSSEQDAEPTSVFYSDKRLAKKIDNFFKQSHIQQTMESSDTNFPLHFVKKPPRLLSNLAITRAIRTAPLEGILSFWTVPLEHQAFVTACGLPIAATLSDASAWATIGGNVLIDGTLFGMTAGHLVTRLLPSHEEGSHSDACSPGRSSLDDSSMSESDTSESDTSSLGITATRLFDLATANKIDSRDLSEWEYREDIINLDYALLPLPPDLRLPNRLDKSKINFGKEKVSNELLDLSEINAELRLERRDVVLMTANGYKPAVLKATGSSLLVSPSTNFVKTLTLSLTQGFFFETGDSGSWVVESSQGLVYGHLVAALADGDAIVVPIHTSLENMKERLKANNVSLPGPQDIRDLSIRITDEPSVFQIPQSTAKPASYDGTSSISTWMTSISSQSRTNRIVKPMLPPLTESPVSDTPSDAFYDISTTVKLPTNNTVVSDQKTEDTIPEPQGMNALDMTGAGHKSTESTNSMNVGYAG